MQLFGRKLFEHEVKKLWDFNGFGNSDGTNILAYADPISLGAVTIGSTTIDKKKKKVVEKPKITPKELFKLEALNEQDFKIGTDATYLERAIRDCSQKLKLMPVPQKPTKKNPYPAGGAEKHGYDELKSIIERLENRKKIHDLSSSSKAVFESYPHTTVELVNKVLSENKHLALETAGKYVPDFPVEAVEAMADYKKFCKEVCGKETYFYVISKKEDFQVVNKRRDPILLAQSPFGFFWQILGAWDEEMIYLGDL